MRYCTALSILDSKGTIGCGAVRVRYSACAGCADASGGARRAGRIPEDSVRIRRGGGRTAGTHGEGARGLPRQRRRQHRIRARARDGSVRRTHSARAREARAGPQVRRQSHRSGPSFSAHCSHAAFNRIPSQKVPYKYNTS